MTSPDAQPTEASVVWAARVRRLGDDCGDEHYTVRMEEDRDGGRVMRMYRKPDLP